MNILSILLQAREPAAYKLNYDEHYLISVPLATFATPGVASYDDDYFSITDGEVTLKSEFLAEINNKVDKIEPVANGEYAYTVQNDNGDYVPGVREISTAAQGNKIAMRDVNGVLYAEAGTTDKSVVNKIQLVAATTNIPESHLSVDVQAKLNKNIYGKMLVDPSDWPVAEPNPDIMYFVGPYMDSQNNPYYVEYMWIDDTWEPMGSTLGIDMPVVFFGVDGYANRTTDPDRANTIEDGAVVEYSGVTGSRNKVITRMTESHLVGGKIHIKEAEDSLIVGYEHGNKSALNSLPYLRLVNCIISGYRIGGKFSDSIIVGNVVKCSDDGNGTKYSLIVVKNFNSTKVENSIVVGENHSAGTCSGIVMLGDNNDAGSNNKTYLIGNHLKGKTGNVIVGQYNATGLDVWFQVGTGDSSNRETGFCVDTEGSISAGTRRNLIIIGGKKLYERQVAQLQFIANKDAKLYNMANIQTIVETLSLEAQTVNNIFSCAGDHFIVVAVLGSSVSYTYTTDSAFLDAVQSGLQIGYNVIIPLTNIGQDRYYLENKKLDAQTDITSYIHLYAKLADGSQGFLNAVTSPLQGGVPIYRPSGRLRVGTPDDNADATTKLFCDQNYNKKRYLHTVEVGITAANNWSYNIQLLIVSASDTAITNSTQIITAKIMGIKGLPGYDTQPSDFFGTASLGTDEGYPYGDQGPSVMFTHADGTMQYFSGLSTNAPEVSAITFVDTVTEF